MDIFNANGNQPTDRSRPNDAKLTSLEDTMKKNALESINSDFPPLGPVADAAQVGVMAKPQTPTISADLANGILESLLNARVKPNDLNDYQQVGYHFRLFLTEDEDLLVKAGSASNIKDVFSVLDSGEVSVITLAETGVTTYNIRDVEIESNISPNALTRNVNSFNFTITISEPMGVGFLESIRLAADALRIRNYSKTIYYLELNFLGYKDADGSISTNPIKGTDSGGRWIWPISLISIDTRLDTSGGVYTITAHSYSDVAFFSENKEMTLHFTPEVITPVGNTIGDMMKDYATKLTESWRQRYGGKLVTFNIILHTLTGPLAANSPHNLRDPKTFKIKTLSPEKNSAINLTLDSPSGAYKASVASGTYVSDLIEFAFTNSEEGQHSALDRGGIQGQTSISPSSPNTKNFRESIIYRVEPDVKITGFDYSSGNYIREVNLHVQGHYTQAIVTDTVQRDSMKSPQAQFDSIKAMIDKGFISKRYDYLYSGLNTEILDLDVHFNLTWNVLLPKLEGARMNMDDSNANARSNPTNNNPGGNVNEVKLKVLQKEAQVALNNFFDTSAKLDTSNKEIADLKAKLALNPSADQARILQQQIDEKTLRSNDLFSTKEAQVAKSEAARTAANAAAEVIRNEVAVVKGSIYAEELVEKANSGNTDQELPLKVSFAQFYKQASEATGTGFIGQFHRDKSVFGAVLGQLYISDQQALYHIDMQIRGDPYWLGKTSLERQLFFRHYTDGTSSSTSTPSTSNPDLPEWWMGDQVILLTFRYPIMINDDYSPNFKADDVISSLYRVKSIKHSFTGGAFRQTLGADRLPLVEIFRAFNYAGPIDGIYKAADTPLTNGPPQTATPTGTPIASDGAVGKQAFVAAYTPYALAQSAKTGISPEIILAQTALETGWGAHAPGNNYFGIKGPGQVLQTKEADSSGALVGQTASFAGYQTPEASFNAYGNFVSTPRYANLRNIGASGGSLAEQSSALQASGYATDPNYGKQVLAIASNLQIKKS